MTQVSATINGNGDVLSNPTGGISDSQRVGEGLYVVRFANKFDTVPTVVATQHYPGNGDFTAKGGDTRDNAIVVALNKSRVKFKTGRADGLAANRKFSFIAMG